MTNQQAKRTLVSDGLANALTGAGTTVDKRMANQWVLRTIGPAEIDAAYSTSWAMRAVVDTFPEDMTRAWRDWQAEGPQIEALEREEQRLDLVAHVRQALKYGQLGGGVLVLGVDGDPSQPANPEAVRVGGLRFVNSISRHMVHTEPLILDTSSPWFMHPAGYRVSGPDGQSVTFHPSRVVAFKGLPSAGVLNVAGSDEWFWGVSVVSVVNDAVMNSEDAQAGFAALISEAAVDVLGIPNLMDMVGSDEYAAILMRRIQIAKQGKSSHRMLVRDALETWETRQISWSGIPDVIRTYLSIVAAASGIPATRLLGKSPDGMNSTGEGDMRNHYEAVASRQARDLAPLMRRVDEFLIRSALGSRPPEIYFEWAPLSVPTEKESAEIENKEADTISKLAATGLIPDVALAKATVNRLIESGRFPGLEAAMDELPSIEDILEAEAEEARALASRRQPADPSELAADPEDEGQEDAAPRRRVSDSVAPRRNLTAAFRDAMRDFARQYPRIFDAAPKPLYVRRDVVNAAEITAWAQAQGFRDIVPDMHVTITYSRKPVDWLEMGEDWSGDGSGRIEIQPGGPRVVEPLGKATAVLLFVSSHLQYRHMSMRERGASSDFPDYVPHITISYAAGGPDLANVEPYRGKIVLGPEIFETFKENPYG